MSSVDAIVKDGVITNGTSSTSTSTSDTSSSTAAIKEQKDQFMQLLVAQMKYQDPLEPTSNTEYIAQYATFSELEQIQNMSQNMSLSRASDYVGKTVIVESTDAAGNTTQVQGTVDYVTFSSGSAYVNIDGTNYNADNVKTVVDSAYETATASAQAVMDEIDSLPALGNLDSTSAQKVATIYAVYSAMGSKAQSYMDSNYVTALEQYYQQAQSYLDE